jgi:hypothetical protein
MKTDKILRSPWFRLAVVIFTPVLVLLGLLIIIINTILCGTWCAAVKMISWILYEDEYVLGRWWWPWDFIDEGEMKHHRFRTNQSKLLFFQKKKKND